MLWRGRLLTDTVIPNIKNAIDTDNFEFQEVFMLK
jgi:hypothetical protein